MINPATFDRLVHQSFLHNVKLGLVCRATRDDPTCHARSDRTPTGTTYYVNRHGCTCPGFLSHGRCHHWARLRFELSLDADGLVPCYEPRHAA